MEEKGGVRWTSERGIEGEGGRRSLERRVS